MFLIPPLPVRYSIFSILFVYKVWNNQVDISALMEYINLYVHYLRPRPNLLFYIPRTYNFGFGITFSPLSLEATAPICFFPFSAILFGEGRTVGIPVSSILIMRPGVFLNFFRS